MSKIEINKEFKKYLDQLCENHIIKITKKNETEKAFNYIKEDLINKIIENLEEKQNIHIVKKITKNIIILIQYLQISTKNTSNIYAKKKE